MAGMRIFSVLIRFIVVSLMLISPNVYGEDAAVAREGAFIKYASGVVLDKHSGLEWFVGPDKDIVFDKAGDWIAALKVEGGGWRFPKTFELQGLYKKGAGTRMGRPCITKSFRSTGETSVSGLCS